MAFANQGTQRKAASNRFFVITRWSCPRGGCTAGFALTYLGEGAGGLGLKDAIPLGKPKSQKTHCVKKENLQKPMLDDVIGLQQRH